MSRKNLSNRESIRRLNPGQVSSKHDVSPTKSPKIPSKMWAETSSSLGPHLAFQVDREQLSVVDLMNQWKPSAPDELKTLQWKGSCKNIIFLGKTFILRFPALKFLQRIYQKNDEKSIKFWILIQYFIFSYQFAQFPLLLFLRILNLVNLNFTFLINSHSIFKTPYHVAWISIFSILHMSYIKLSSAWPFYPLYLSVPAAMTIACHSRWKPLAFTLAWKYWKMD